MTAGEVILDAQQHGVTLFRGEGGKLRWRCSGALPVRIKPMLLEHKDSLLEWFDKHEAPSGPWPDQAEADRLLAHLRSELSRIERERFRGTFPYPLSAITADSLTVAERFIRNHEMERRRGWDALQLLRETVAFAIGKAQGWSSSDEPNPEQKGRA